MYGLEDEGMKCPRVARRRTPAEAHLPLEYVSKYCEDLPSWIPGERVTCLGIRDETSLGIRDETSSLHQEKPMNSQSETSRDLVEAFGRARVRPYRRPQRLEVDPHAAQARDVFTNGRERQENEVVDPAGGAKEQNDKIEHHNQLFELILENVIEEAQPQTETEWRECVTELVLENVITETQPQTEMEWRECVIEPVLAKNSLLSATGVSPMQGVFGRNPEMPGDLLKDGPDLISNSEIVNDPVAAQQTRSRTIAHKKVLMQQDRLAARRALVSRPKVVAVAKHQPDDMVVVRRRMKNGVPLGRRAHHRWRPGICMGKVCGNDWVALPGTVEAELRTEMFDLEHYSGQSFEDIAGGAFPPDEVGEDAPPDPEDQAPPAKAPDVGGPVEHFDLATGSDEGTEEHPTGRRRLRGKQTVDKAKLSLGAEQTTAGATAGGTSAASGQPQVGGVVHPPSMPRPPLQDSADAHLTENVDKDTVVGAVTVLLTQGSEEINARNARRRSPQGHARIERVFEKERTSSVHGTKAGRPIALETSRLLRTQVPERTLRRSRC